MYPRAFNIIFTFILSFTALVGFAQGEDKFDLEVQAPKTFTKGDQIDYTRDGDSKAQKGATVLVWQRRSDHPMAEIEIYRESQPERALRFHSDRNFFHTMVFFEKIYMWRVRYVDENKKALSEYSEAVSFRVLRKGQAPDLPVADVPLIMKPLDDPNVEALVVDTGEGDVVSAPLVKPRTLPADKKPVLMKAPAPRAAPPKNKPVAMQEPPRDPQSEAAADEADGFFVEESDGSDEADFDY